MGMEVLPLLLLLMLLLLLLLLLFMMRAILSCNMVMQEDAI